MLVTGIQGPSLTVAGNLLPDQGLTSSVPRDGAFIQRTAFPVLEGPVPSLESGPARLSVEGLTLQLTRPIQVHVPSDCGGE